VKTEDKNILYIVHSYHSFQKDTIELLAKRFKNVYVIVRYKPIAEISKILPIKSLVIHRKDHILQIEGKPDNVHIYLAPLWYLPFKFFYRYLGKYHFRVVDRLVKKNNIKFDIVHSHFTWTAGYVGMELKKQYGVPFVLTIHTSRTLERQLRLKDKEIISIWRNADALIRVNKNNIQVLKEYNTETFFIPNGFNQELFVPRDSSLSKKSLGLDSNKKILLSIGHLDECKGHIYLIRAIDKLVNREGYGKLRLYLVGEGTQRFRLEREIRDLGLGKYVKLLGGKLHKDIPIWMNACDLFILPSLSESFGIVQLEAFACGKPVVATRTMGSRQLVTSNKFGLLCDIANVDDLSDKIKVAINKKWSKTKIIQHAQAFTWGAIVEKIIPIYKKVLRPVSLKK